MWINDHIDLNPVFTIGYRERKFEDFLKILNEYQLDTLVDIRSQPVSRIQPEFSKRQIELFLNNAGIRYLYLGKELGVDLKIQMYILMGIWMSESCNRNRYLSAGLTKFCQCIHPVQGWC